MAKGELELNKANRILGMDSASSGKTSIAKRIANQTGISRFELDLFP